MQKTAANEATRRQNKALVDRSCGAGCSAGQGFEPTIRTKPVQVSSLGLLNRLSRKTALHQMRANSHASRTPASNQWVQPTLYHWFSWVWPTVYLTSNSCLVRTLAGQWPRISCTDPVQRVRFRLPRVELLGAIVHPNPLHQKVGFLAGREAVESYSLKTALASSSDFCQHDSVEPAQNPGSGMSILSLGHFPFAAQVYVELSVRRSYIPATCKRGPAQSDN